MYTNEVNFIRFLQVSQMVKKQHFDAYSSYSDFISCIQLHPLSNVGFSYLHPGSESTEFNFHQLSSSVFVCLCDIAYYNPKDDTKLKTRTYSCVSL